MLPLEGHDLLRVALFSGVLGFAAFCISYVVFVWRRRNAANTVRPSRLVRAARCSTLLGCLGLVASWAVNEFRGRDGIARGSDLFVVSARRGSAVQNVTSADAIGVNDVVAEYLSPADRTRLHGVELQRAQAQAKRDAIRTRVLQVDEALLQEQSHARTKLVQLQAFAFELRKSRYEIERERTNLQTTWAREENQILADIGAAQKHKANATGHLDVAARALDRTAELRKKDYASEQLLDQRRADRLTSELDVQRHEELVASLKERRKDLALRYSRSDASYSRQISDLDRDLEMIEGARVALQSQLERVERRIAEDQARALLSRARETQAAEYDINILTAERARLIEAAQVRAPFAGKVVYRHASPGLASDGAPILAVSTGTGFAAEIRLPGGEVDELASHAEPIQLALEDPVLHRFFTGRFVRAEPVPFEPSRVIAHIDCSLPPEVIAVLGSASAPVRVRLLWRPPLLKQPSFLISAALLLPGLLTFARRPSRQVALRTPEPMSSQLSAQLTIQVGSEESTLFAMANRLQQQLRTKSLDPQLLFELEVVLSQNHGWAARIIGRGIKADDELRSAAIQCIREQDEHTARRLFLVLRTVAPTVLAETA
jgi:hypothetical protein